MWKRLSELNKEFNEIKKSKKDSKKVFESIIKVNLQNILDKVQINFFAKMSEMGFYSLPTGKLHKKKLKKAG